MTKLLVRTGSGIFLVLALFSAWYLVAADYSYRAVSGTYTLEQNEESSILILKQDGSFQQELTHSGKTERATGSWRRFGEASISFSKEFLKVSGQEADSNGEFPGHVEKSLGLFVSIELNQNPIRDAPVFHKELFH